MIVVSDTTPLIGLANIGRLELLKELFGEVYIPQAVFDESVTFGRKESAAREVVANADWIQVVTVKERIAVDVLLDELDLGEAEAIVLAGEMEADLVLMDEKKGRRKLTQLSISKIGTLGVLLKAREVGLIPSLKLEIEELQKTGFSVSASVVEQILRAAGE